MAKPTKPPEPLFPSAPPPPEEPFSDITWPATLLKNDSSAGSASGTPTGVIKFEVPVEGVGALMALGQLYGRTFDVTFDQCALGILTALRQDSRTDENGSPRAHLIFSVPQSELPKKAQIDIRGLNGRKGKLVLSISQTTMDDRITTQRADDGPQEPCPYPGCTENALHSGKHKVPPDYAPSAALN